jgi:NTP pyrophosphatase (non-canonical NTP hydrolase)
MNTQSIQKAIYANKVAKGFNVTDIPLEFTYLYGEVGEAFEAWRKKRENVGEELADVAIYVLGMAEIL